MIETARLTKTYGAVRALEDVSLRLDTGVVALLGRNGAGKSTLLSILAGLVRETSGTVSLNGVVAAKDRKDLRAAITLLPQALTLDPAVSARVFLEYLFELRGRRDGKPLDALARFGLADVADRPLGTLSGGMRQRFGLSYAFAMNTPVLLLDEPTQGLDPVERLRFTEALADISAERTVLYSTHVVSDVDAVASRVLVLDAGELVFDGSSADMCEKAPQMYAAVVDEAGLQALRAAKGLTAVRRLDADQYAVRWFGAAQPGGAEPVPATLTDAYIALVATDDRC